MLKFGCNLLVFSAFFYPCFATTCDNSAEKLMFISDMTLIPDNSDNSIPVISSLCLNSDTIHDFDRLERGTYCWCRIDSLNNYNIYAKWVNVKNYQKHKFNEEKYRNKKNITEFEIKQKQQEIEKQNIADCTNECATRCQQNVKQLKQNIQGYYICANALYQLSAAQCIIDTKIIDAEKIFVFDDYAEIITKRIHIIFYKDKTDSSNVTYSGEYKNTPVYMKIKNNKIYVGREWFSMEECIKNSNI